jgi:Domain of unknown function (DUF4157)
MVFALKEKKSDRILHGKQSTRSPAESMQHSHHLSESAHLLQRSLGNHYLQSISQTAMQTDGLYIQRACAYDNSRGKFLEREEEHQKLQHKLIVGPPDDEYEQEADRVADMIMHMQEPQAQQAATMSGQVETSRIHSLRPQNQKTLQRQSVEEEIEERTPRILTKGLSDHTAEVTPGLAARIDTLQSEGQPLPSPIQAFFESSLGSDFSAVRVHNDAKAAETAHALKARAFTLGSNIVFGAGHYTPETIDGRRLLAHELVHVVQQSGGIESIPMQERISRVQNPIVQRAISRELDQIESYLSYGVFDWAITDKEAIRSLELLESLPRYQQAVFFANPKYVNRLRENLPEERVREFNKLEREVAPIQPPIPTIEDIRSKLSYGLFDWVVTDREAIEALEMLKQLSGSELAVALGSINYGRLMDNLPDNRKQELIDLLAQTLGTGGSRETEEKQHPGTVLNRITFRSDHGFMKDNISNWENTGTVYGDPEWFISDGKAISHPISQTRNSRVEIDVNLNVLPITAPEAPIKLIGKSDESSLNFEFTGTMSGGLNQTVALASSGLLPNRITAITDKRITWIMEWRDWMHEIGQTGPHTIFVTMDKPLKPDEVTQKRMALAVSLAGAIDELVPHPLVKGIMARWGAYNLDIKYPDNAWKLADNLDLGAQCIDIVRFVNGILETIGCPGTASAVVIAAMPDTPMVPFEDLWGTSNPGLWKVGPHPAHPTWFIGLMDANGCPNAYEAALKFDHSSTLRYYPGGVSMDREYKNPTDVLYIFQCLAWLTSIANKEAEIQSILATYPDGVCTLGRIRCR